MATQICIQQLFPIILKINFFNPFQTLCSNSGPTSTSSYCTQLYNNLWLKKNKTRDSTQLKRKPKFKNLNKNLKTIAKQTLQRKFQDKKTQKSQVQPLHYEMFLRLLWNLYSSRVIKSYRLIQIIYMAPVQTFSVYSQKQCHPSQGLNCS